MADGRTLRRHVREKGVIDHLADTVFDSAASEAPTVQDAKTGTGLPVEDQVRKKWNPSKGGLPIFTPK